MNKQPIQTPIKIDIAHTEGYKCSCGNETFEAVQFFRKVPALLSPTLKPELVAVPAFRCSRCKKMVDFENTGSEKAIKTGKTLLFLAGIARTILKMFRK
jgi:hypothetical protein